MKGFDKHWKDFPDFIIGITNEIWEKREIASLHRYYSDDIPVRSPAGISQGNKETIAITMGTLAEFPDRRLYGEDVIWSGSPEEGLHSSHRIFSTATHLGNGVYGKATGKKLGYRIIADTHAINNQINDEWLVRDQGAIVRQIGWDPKDFAVDLFRKTIKFDKQFEEIIIVKAKNWDLDRIAIMDQIMIKMAFTEILNMPELPVKVSLNEYIEISKYYSTNKSKMFINGLIDSAVKDFTNQNIVPSLEKVFSSSYSRFRLAYSSFLLNNPTQHET